MRLTQRQRLILDHLREEGHVEVKELAASLGVDGSTIRRDLQQLSRTGRVQRIHGGVRLVPDAGPEPEAFPPRRAELAIAGSARSLLRSGGSLVLGAGPIGQHLVPMLLEVEDITVVTNDLRAAERLSRHRSARVLVAGGEMRDAPDSAATSGEATTAFIADQRVEWAFLEFDGVHPYAGLTTASPWQVATKRAMLAAAARRCVMATSATFGVRTLGFVTEVGAVDLLITDEALPDADLPAFGGKVVRAAPEAADDWRIDLDRYTS